MQGRKPDAATLNKDHSGWRELESSVRQRLSEREQQDRLRRLSTRVHSDDWLDLTHNDYLGLGHCPDFQLRVRARCRQDPVGAGASRLLGGEHPVFEQLEKAFAQFKNLESCLYVSSGYVANEMVGSLLSLPDARVFSDQLNHASIIDGLRLSALPKDRRCIFAHNDLDDLENQLRASDASINFIWTESVFSMDGDLAPLSELLALADSYRGVLIVDEAHALACFGQHGEGLIQAAALDPKRIISINPCGKAFAASGAVIGCPTWFRDYLINFARPFIFSTGPSPWLAHAVLEALATVPKLHKERQQLAANSSLLRHKLQGLGLQTGLSNSHIIPVIVGEEKQALALEAFLKNRKILAKAIRPPTVAPNSCRIRLSLHSRLQSHHIENIIEAFQEWQKS